MYRHFRSHKLRTICSRNSRKFLQESTLHGLRFIGDESLTLWERCFFLCAFVAAIITTGNLISYIYTRWTLTPIIIATNPFPTSISHIPFPAITICNMNKLLNSKVANYSSNSFESAIIDMICIHESNKYSHEVPTHYKNNNLSITDFIVEHAQPCSNMLYSCRFNSLHYNCSDLFREYLTDEGMCCVFNLADAKFRYKVPHKIRKDYTNSDGAVPVDWSPENGFQKQLPKEYYPRTSDGIGVSMGLSLILNAQVDDYYCSSTNGPGFKIDLHNPIEAPRIKDIGLSISTGYDTRLRISARMSSAMPSIRGFSRSVRKCLFNDESNLLYYRYYTRKNCENECGARFLLRVCKCIPHNLPLIVANASVCGAPKSACINKANKMWLRSNDLHCRQQCMRSCFDLKYISNSFSSPLIQGNYAIQNARQLEGLSMEDIKNNIAVVNIFFHEYVFNGEIRNVYVGFNEFLSNIGGILGLFLGFSFISLIEVFYYGILRPIFSWKQTENQSELVRIPEKVLNTTIWHSHELYPTKQKNFQNGWLTYRHHKLNKLSDNSIESPLVKNVKKTGIYRRINHK